MKTRALGMMFGLVLMGTHAYAENVAVSHKGEVVQAQASPTKPQPKRPFVVPQNVGAPIGVVVTPEANTNIDNPQVRPACWTESCSDASRLQSGG